MKEKPIIFSTESVQAILEGRKTQARRVVKNIPRYEYFEQGRYHPEKTDKEGNMFPGNEVIGIWGDEWDIPARYQIGDVLWVKERYTTVESVDDAGRENGFVIIYAADLISSSLANPHLVKWKNPMFMPRKYARLFLRVTGVRCERLNDISKQDVMSEGFVCNPLCNPSTCSLGKMLGTRYGDCKLPKGVFQATWNKINKKHPWVSNPWVWCIEFEVCNGQ